MSARYGARVAIAEERDLGGTCVNVGCIPKKLLVYASAFRRDTEDAAGFGWTAAPPSHDWRALIRNKDAEIARLNGVYARLLDDAVRTHLASELRGQGIDLRFDAEVVRIDEASDGALRATLRDGSALEGDAILFATGRHPHTRDLGLEELKVEQRANGAIRVDE